MAAKSKVKKSAAKAKSSGKKPAAKAHKYVYTWGAGKADGHGGMKPLLGGKGANLAEMTRIGLPVPPGFTITTEVCTYFYQHKKTYPKELQAQMAAGVANMEKIMGTKFGATDGTPLLVAVRSGARDSMPGMMDTILNLGLNDQTVLALVKATQNERFAWDCYRRFIQMYGDVVLGVQKKEGEDHEPFETVIHAFKHEKYHADIEDSKLTAEDQQELVKRFKALVLERREIRFRQVRQLGVGRHVGLLGEPLVFHVLSEELVVVDLLDQFAVVGLHRGVRPDVDLADEDSIHRIVERAPGPLEVVLPERGFAHLIEVLGSVDDRPRLGIGRFHGI